MATAQSMVTDYAALPEGEQAAVRLAIAQIPPPKGRDLGRLWLLLIGGVMGMAALAGVAAFVFYVDGNGTVGGVFLAVTTTIIGAILGLFAESPAST